MSRVILSETKYLALELRHMPCEILDFSPFALHPRLTPSGVDLKVHFVQHDKLCFGQLLYYLQNFSHCRKSPQSVPHPHLPLRQAWG